MSSSLDEDMRWRQVWWFLSLDCVARFSRDLLVPVRRLSAVQEQVRSQITSAIETDKYHNIPGFMPATVRDWFLSSHAMDEAMAVAQWATNIYVRTGSDRAAEFIWNAIVSRVAANRLPMPVRFSSAAVQIREQMKSARQQRNNLSTDLAISSWDLGALQFERATEQSLREKIKGIIELNDFALAWHHHSHLFSGELPEVFKIAQAHTSETMPEVQLGYPGNWALAVEPLLATLRSGA